VNNIIIITGHGKYATGLKNAIELITGITDGIYSVDFEENDSDTILKNKIEKIIEENKNRDLLIICDIVGGTPFKISAEFSMGSNRIIEVVAGCNLSGILEVVLQKDKLTVKELAEMAVNATKNTVLNLNKDMDKTPDQKEKEIDEGI